MSSLDACASSDVEEVEVGAEGSGEDYCEELQQPEEEVTLDVCQSSRTCPLPKAGAPATGPLGTDPPCRSNELLAVLLAKEVCWNGCPVPAHTCLDHLQTRPRRSGGIISGREMSSRLLLLQQHPPERRT